MPARKDPVRVVSHVIAYAAFYLSPLILGFGFLMQWLAGALAGMTLANLAAALFANWIALKIFAERPVMAIGLWWNRASADNFTIGLIGGIGAACVVLALPLGAGAAHFARMTDEQPTIWAAVFLTVFLLVGSAAEEILFRGFGFQTLLASFGAWASIVPGALLFGLLHLGNPGATWLGIVNTMGFGAVFGYGCVRSRDLWLPIGLHFGWNFTLPLFGVNVSGLRMNETGYEMSWTAGALWSGGAYGPEASVLTSAVVVLLFLYVWKAPVRRQSSPLTDPPAESAVCDSSLPLPS
jgi:membrane protease YdiL (CAAX protease family)